MNKYKIMIVDDEPDILELLEKSLAIEGFQNITKVDNGLSAVSSCHTLQPDMIILDVMLPNHGNKRRLFQRCAAVDECLG